MSNGQRTLCILAALLAAFGGVLLGLAMLSPETSESTLRGLELLAMSALAFSGAIPPVWKTWHDEAPPSE